MLRLKFLLFFIFIFLFLIACSCDETNVKSDYQREINLQNRCTKDFSSKVCVPAKNFIYVIGKGAAPNDENLTEVQRYLLAERAAILDGYRKLAEKLQGFIVTTLTKAGDFVINMDLVKVQTEALIKGAEIEKIEHNENGVCTAKIKIEIPKKNKIVSMYNSYSKM